MSVSLSQLELERVLDRFVPDPKNFSLDTWARRLECFEDRAIQFLELDLPLGCFGGCIIVMDEAQGLNGTRHPATEYVVYASSLSPAHREHVKAHELAHITLNHPTLVLTPHELMDWASRKSVSPNMIRFCCRAADRSNHNYEQEDLDAEYLTRTIYQRVFAAQQRAGRGRFSSLLDLERALQQAKLT